MRTSGVPRCNLSVPISTEYRVVFFFSSRRRHTRLQGDWSSDVCSSDLGWLNGQAAGRLGTCRGKQTTLRLRLTTKGTKDTKNTKASQEDRADAVGGGYQLDRKSVV